MSGLSKTVMAAAEKHARAEFPREACGLVVVRRGRRAYVPCQNAAKAPEDHFIITPEAFAAAEALGEVVGIFHSHPNATAHPSTADLQACNASGVAWHILALPSGTWTTTRPKTPSMPLYGREFSHGSCDCYGFVRDWYAQELGIELDEFSREDEWWRKGKNLYVDNFASQGLVVVTDGTLQRGDILLMQVLADVPNHAAIYLGDDVIGHHLYGRLSGRDVYGGYYKKHTTHVLRRKQ
jgi:proteasome lid subunit RPN8/RPN11